ncbi:MAG: hypothetical protein VYE42_03755, partial [Actinomycetota bacterium]|nr:hypothetical protein [Actinomycetota bacterium]
MTIDTVVPELTWVDLASNNVKHKQLAKGGDTIFLTMNATEWIDTPVVSMTGRVPDTIARYGSRQYDTWHSVDEDVHEAHYLFGSCPVYNATITVVGSHLFGQETPFETQGNVTFSISSIQDPAGNMADDVTETTHPTADAGWVTIDTVVPLIQWVDMRSNNVKHMQLAKEGDTVFLTINASEWIDEPAVQMNGRTPDSVIRYGTRQYDTWHSIDADQHEAHYLFGSCPVYNASFTVVGSHLYAQEEPFETQGNVTVSITNVQDAAGNIGSNVSDVTRETAMLGWVTIDTVIPVVTWVDIVSNNAKHPQLAKGDDTIFMTINASEWI